jgi:hypothetical protein
MLQVVRLGTPLLQERETAPVKLLRGDRVSV